MVVFVFCKSTLPDIRGVFPLLSKIIYYRAVNLPGTAFVGALSDRKRVVSMEYVGEEALGLVETRGMVPAIEAADVMCKTADVVLVSYENMGSGLVTVMVKGDVAAVRSAVEKGAAAAAAIGELTASHVMPRPVSRVGKIVSRHDIDAD